MPRRCNTDARLTALRRHLAEGAADADLGVFVEDFSLEKLIAELDQEAVGPSPLRHTPA